MAEKSAIRKAYDKSYGRLFAAIYDRMLAGAEEAELGEQRGRVVSRAKGRTLEIGAGTGLNLPRYGEGVSELVLTEPFEPMARRLRERQAELGRAAEVVETPAEKLPFEDASFDTVIATLVLCTVDDQARTLAEIGRVLRPGGALHLLEHVRAETPGMARAQDILHWPWFAFGHGCHCNRDTAAALEASPLRIEQLERRKVPGLAPIVAPMIVASAALPA